MELKSQEYYVSREHLIIAGFLLICILLPLFLIIDVPYLPLALVLGIFIIFLILLKPFIGLLFYSIFLLVRPQEFISFLMAIPLPLERITAVILIVSIILLYAKDRSTLITKLNNIDKGLIFYLLITLASVATSIWISHSWEIWLQLLRLFFVYIFAVKIIQTKKQLKIFIFFIILTSAFHAFAAVIRYYMGIREIEMGIERAFGLDSSYGDPNSLAPTLVYSLPFIYYYFTKNTPKILRVLLIVFAIAMIWCVILTGSRTGMMGAIFFILMVIWYNKNKVRNIIIAILLLFSTWAVMPGQYKGRFESVINFDTTDDATGAASSARGRIAGFKNGLKMLSDRPFLGYGIGNFGIASGMIYTHTWFQSHNLIGQIFGEIGILGTIAFILWIYTLFKYLNKLQKRYQAPQHEDKFMYNMATALKIQLLCLFFLGLGGHNLMRYNWFIISALTAVMINLSNLENKATHNKDIALKTTQISDNKC